MSDDPTTTDAQDELVSAYVDGEATPEEVARVEASAELLARAEVMRSVAAAVASPSPPSPSDARDAAIAAALAEAGPGRNVTELAAVRARRRLRIASVAAGVLVALAIGAGLLAQAGRDDKATTTAAKTGVSAASSSAAAPERSGATGAAAADGPAPDTFATGATIDLGDFADTAALVNATRARITALSTPQDSAAGAGTAAAGAAPTSAGAACPRPPGAEFEALARLDGETVTVLVVGPPDRQVIQLVDAGCTVIFTQPL
ncbi:MAG: hypothetical protein QOH64_2160 [Acidimicrobiaceae bacterium]|jgi:hypothetical protein